MRGKKAFVFHDRAFRDEHIGDMPLFNKINTEAYQENFSIWQMRRKIALPA